MSAGLSHQLPKLEQKTEGIVLTKIVDKIWTGKNIQSSWNWGYTLSLYTNYKPLCKWGGFLVVNIP